MAQVITTILLDGNPKGFRQIEIGNWVGKAFVVPRAKLKEFRTREDTNKPGVYFLFGGGIEKPSVYIGQSENVAERLASHDTEREEEEWNEAFVFVQNLDSTLIKYLESKAVHFASEANRYQIFNNNKPGRNAISESQKIIAVDYFEMMKIITGLFGYPVFEDPKEQAQTKATYSFEDVRNKDASATGTLLDSGEFVVFKGSKARIATTPGLEKHGRNVVALREELILKEILSLENDKSYVFTQDYVFSSPSMAATVVAGRACNGWICWKDKQGKSLDENVRK